MVDDTPDNVRLLSAMLTEAGYQVRKALNANRALSTVEASPPDLILLDIMMPDMDGYQVCQQLKAQEQTRDIPVIFISALDDVLDKVKAFEIGGVDYIAKPFQQQEVLARVRNHLIVGQQQRQISEQNERLKREIKDRENIELALRIAQQKSERLLLNILPRPIVARLKEIDGPIAEHFEEVTVLFADIVGFTSFASSMSPLKLVGLLNRIFSQFDQLVEKHDLEKIKTIGDAYMVVGGLPVPREDHASAVADMALDMIRAIASVKVEASEPLQMRIGMHIGPVVAGTIGTKKFSYDLWGDTVNVASRMESLGEAGKIQATAALYDRLKDKYIFAERGQISVKGKGEMITYWLKGKV